MIRVGDVRLRRRGTPQSQMVAALVKSAGYLSRNKYGALIAIQRGVDLSGWAENGTLIRGGSDGEPPQYGLLPRLTAARPWRHHPR